MVSIAVAVVAAVYATGLCAVCCCLMGGWAEERLAMERAAVQRERLTT